MILSYVVIQALCMLLFIIPSTEAIRVLKVQSQEKQADRALLFSDQADLSIDAFRNMAVALLSEPEISRLAHMNITDLNQQYLAVLSTLRRLNSLYGNTFDQIYLSFRNQDSLLGVAGKLDKDSLYNLLPFNNLSPLQYETLFSAVYQPASLFVADDGTLYYRYTLPFRYTQGQSINLIFSLPMHMLFNRTLAETPEIYGMVLSDGTLHTSQAISADLQAEILAGVATADAQYAAYALSTGQTLCVVPSDSHAAHYVYVNNPDQYASAMTRHLRYLWLTVTFFFVASGLLIGYFVRGQYRPIKALLALLNSQDAGEMRLDEYKKVLSYLAQLRMRHDKYQSVLKDHGTEFTHLLYRRLLSGESITQDEHSTFEQLFEGDGLSGCFCVIVMSTARGSALPNCTDEPYVEATPLVREILENLLTCAYRVELLEYHRLLCCILNTQDEECLISETSIARLRPKLEKAYDQLKTQAQLYCDFYIGNFHQGADTLEQSYREAMQCVERNATFGACSILFYGDAPCANGETQRFTGIYSMECEYKLLSRLKAADVDFAQDAVRALFSRAYAAEQVSPLVLKSLCQNMLCTYLKALNGLPVHDENKLQERISECLEMDFRPYPPRDVQNLFCELARKTCECVGAESGKSPLKLFQEIVAYVSSELADPNLSVASISEHFSYSASALSGYFSSMNGDGLHNYINHQRIQAACTLMEKQPDSSLAEIAEATGFTNLRTFSRVFSGETGASPGKYRKTLSKDV
ncbi:MAG: helix-turn-helix transcriptional regulator [Clostridia bacterium]